MANEIISNAAKHGTRPGERLALELRLESRDGSFVLSISDEGPGFDIDAARAKGHLGMVLIESLVSQLGAELSVDASGPTRYELRVPQAKAPAEQGALAPAGPATPCPPSAATGPQPA
jgi:two-component sensor histidine kinase